MDQAQIAKIVQQIVSGGGTAALSAVNPIAAGLQVIPEAYKMGQAIKQGIQANQIRKGLVRPTMPLPPSMVEATQNARMQAMDSRLPGQQFAENRILTNQAGANAGIMNSGGGTSERLAAMVAANKGAMDARLQLAEAGANYQAQDINNLNQQLNQQANMEQQMWDYNERQKFYEKGQAASQLGTDSNRNAYSALMGMGGAIASAINTPQQGAQTPSQNALLRQSIATGLRPPPSTNPNAPSAYNDIFAQDAAANQPPVVQPMVWNRYGAVRPRGAYGTFNPNANALPMRQGLSMPDSSPLNIQRPQYTPIKPVDPIYGYKPRGGYL